MLQQALVVECEGLSCRWRRYHRDVLRLIPTVELEPGRFADKNPPNANAPDEAWDA